MITAFNHLANFVRSAEKSVDFYTKAFGAKIVRDLLIPATNTKVIYLQIADGLIELIAPGDLASQQYFGFEHIAFLSDDMDNDFQKLVDAGYKALVHPQVAGSGNGRICFLADPNGLRVELIQRNHSFFEEFDAQGVIRKIEHISIRTEDLKASVKFYTQHLPMCLVEPNDINHVDETAREYVNFGATTLEIAHKVKSHVSGPLIDHIVFGVNDLSRLVDQWEQENMVFERIGENIIQIIGPDDETIFIQQR